MRRANGLAQRQRRDWRDSYHFSAIPGKPTLFTSGEAAVRLEPVLGRVRVPTLFFLKSLCKDFLENLYVHITERLNIEASFAGFVLP
jgi:hypothetical protein